jgi:tRNA 2-thiouridine synthesizing protein A
LGNKIKPNRELDCVGLYCPEPVFRTRQELDKLDVGQVLKVVADDPAAEEDIPRLVKRLEQQLVEMHKEKDQFHFIIKKIK